ncbi:substrate-binding periplasmic protein [Neptuniibacter sp. QD29_5]|uniref:substrate-binding periplasmic protein n=1 Tax=Neptuniibacter sp. QD29_5 TaxID=3398207 RepID=UPI0039F574A1
MYKLWSVFAALIISCTFAKAAEEITVPIYDQDRSPLSIIKNGQAHGIYPDLFREILIGAGLKPQLLPVPPMRRRIGFENQLYHLACCANPAWRARPREQEVQVFSKQFYWTKDMFIFPKGKSFEINKLSQLSDKLIATVRGFDYRGSEHFGEKVNFQNEATLMRALALGRADVGIVNEDILNASAQKKYLEAGPIHDEASLHIRIHRARIDLVEPINKSIDNLISSGRRDQIVKKYLNQHNAISSAVPNAAP